MEYYRVPTTTEILKVNDVLTTIHRHKKLFQGMDLRSKGGVVLKKVKGNILQWHSDRNRVHFIIYVGKPHQKKVHPRVCNYIYGIYL